MVLRLGLLLALLSLMVYLFISYRGILPPIPSPSPTLLPPPLEIRKLTQDCRPKDFTCYENALKGTFAAYGPNAAYRTLAQASKENSDVDYHCHTLMHYLGEDALASASGNIPRAIAQGGMACQSGFSHGALEEFFGKTVEADMQKKLPSVCEKATRSERTTCWHFIGHGLGFLYDNDIYKAVSRCEYLKETGEQDACFEGVFMENFGSDGRQHKPKLVSADKPLEPCLSARTNYKRACFVTIGTYLLRLAQNDAPKAHELCGQAEEQYREVCQQGTTTRSQSYLLE